MRNSFALFLLLLVFSISLSAQVTYTVSFSKSALEMSSVKGKDFRTYTALKYAGLQTVAEPGSPALPLKAVSLIIPYNKDVSDIQIDKAEWETIQLPNKIMPYQNFDEPGRKSSSFDLPDPRVYNSDASYPEKIVTLTNSGYYDGYNHIARLNIAPFQYISKSNTLRILTSLSFTLQCGKAATGYIFPLHRSMAAQSIQDKALETMVDNPEMISAFQPIKSWLNSKDNSKVVVPSYFYTIITTAGLQSSFDEFVEWKKSKGIPTGVVTLTSILNEYQDGDHSVGKVEFPYPIVDAAGCLRQYLRDAWSRGTVFVLLAGDKESIPYRLAWHNPYTPPGSVYNKIPTDLYFQEFNGDWDYNGNGLYGEYDPQNLSVSDRPDFEADISIGRILCATSTEAQAWTDKVMEYERNPFDGDFGKAYKMLWSEADELQYYGFVAMNSTLPGVSSFYNRIISETPSDSALYPTGPSGKQIIDSINNGFGWYNVYNHGASSLILVRCPGWLRDTVIPGSPFYAVTVSDSYNPPNYANESGNGLNNISYHSSTIVYSTACRNAEYNNAANQECMADEFTTMSGAGGPAFIGYTKDAMYSYSPYYHQSFLGCLTNNNYASFLSKTLGFMMRGSFTGVSHSTFSRYSYNLFGDPTMSVWSTVPMKFTNVSVTDNGTSVTINTGVDRCYISVKSFDGSYSDSTDIYYGCGSHTFNTTVRPLKVILIRENYIPYTFMIGGTATYDVTLRGRYPLYTDLTIPAGKTLTFQYLTSLFVKPGKSITIAGTLNVNRSYPFGALLDRDGNSGTWGPFVLQGVSASNSVVSNVLFRNGSGIQLLNGANARIQECSLQYFTNGIYVYNSFPNIENNSIMYTSGHGIYGQGAWSLNRVNLSDNSIWKDQNSSGYGTGEGIYFGGGVGINAYLNDISGYNDGMYIGGGSAAYFYSLYPEISNRMRSNSFAGLNVSWGGYIDGADGQYGLGGYNSIYGNGIYTVLAQNSSLAFVCKNFWGSNPYFYTDGTSYIDHSLPLAEDPWAKKRGGHGNGVKEFSAVVSDNDEQSPRQARLNTAISCENSGMIEKSFDAFTSMLNKNESPLYALNSIARLSYLHKLTKGADFLKQTAEASGKYQAYARMLLARIALAENKTDEALAGFDAAAALEPESYAGMSAKLDKLFALLHLKKDTAAAKAILRNLQKENADLDEIKIRLSVAEALISGTSLELKTKPLAKDGQKSNIPSEYALSQNYPNPFNPSTTIEYQLPAAGNVTLKVFDILGSEVMQLVNAKQEAGTYKVTVNAQNLSSGVYIYQIKCNNFCMSKKLTVLK